jgi:type II secretory pathway pseudopilin PulG
LIELIVVVAIIAILVALSFPVIGKAQMLGRKTKTMANMRQLGVATLAYVADNDNRFPGPTSQGIYLGYTRNTVNQISSMLRPYLGLPRQSDMAAGQSVTVPQLEDPGYLTYNPNPTSSVPQFVQKLGFPTTSPLAGRRPFGALEQVDPEKQAPLTAVDFLKVRAEQRWVLCTGDRQIVGLTAPWKAELPPRPVYGDRHRLYSDGHVAMVAPTDTN